MFRPALSLLILIAVALASLAVLPGAETTRPEFLILDDFQELQNACGGYRNAFYRSPCRAEARRFSVSPGGDRCLKIEVDRQDTGFCGAWVHLFDMRRQERNSIDASTWTWLSFRVRGETGGESFDVRVADERWAKKEDALTIGPVTDWLPNGVTPEWQTVHIPLEDLRRLDQTRLASISFSFSEPGRHVIYIDDLCLGQRPDDPPQRDIVVGSQSVTESRPKAMWVWSTAQLVADDTECKRLFNVCEQQGINLLWVQLPYGLTHGADEVSCEIRQAPLLRSFVERAHARGIDVHALDGCPEFSVKHRHAIPLAVIDSVIAFNDGGSQPAQQFDGVHFDNEPYLLMGWSNDTQREEILTDLMALNVECQERCRQAGLEFGVDIPFWWSAIDRESGQSVGAVTFAGQRKSAAFHCIEQLDNVGIMNYRDRADGADGMLAHGLPLLEHARQLEHAAVFMGIETFRYTPQPVWFVGGLPDDEFRAALADRGRDYYDISRETGLRLYRLHDGENVHVGVEFPDDADRQADATRIAARLALRFGHFSDGQFDTQLLQKATESVEKSQEWTDFVRRDIADDETGLTFPGFLATRLMASKVTFADNPTAEIAAETSFAEETFGRYRSYRGFAIHSWESYQHKLEQP